jgi:hypothetical protein
MKQLPICCTSMNDYPVDTQQINKTKQVHREGFLMRFALSLARFGRRATYKA